MELKLLAYADYGTVRVRYFHDPWLNTYWQYSDLEPYKMYNLSDLSRLDKHMKSDPNLRLTDYGREHFKVIKLERR